MQESKYHDARIIAPYSPDEPHYLTPTKITLGANAKADEWKPAESLPHVRALFDMLAHHPEARAKDGLAFVCGELIPGPRLKTAVTAMYALGFDWDDGDDPKAIDAAFLNLGCAFLRYTSFSNGKTRSDFGRDAVCKFLKCSKSEIDSAAMQRYVREKERWTAEIAATVELIEVKQVSGGFKCFISHAPLHKNRVILPLAAPFVINDYEGLQEATKAWNALYFGVAESIGLLEHLDRTGADLNRLFYFPRHPKGGAHDTVIAGGPLLDLSALDFSNPWAEESEAIGGANKTSKSKTQEGRDLGKWWITYGHRLQIADLLRNETDKVRSPASAGVTIECPFDEEHSNAGDASDTGCFAVDAGDGRDSAFVRCQHNSCREYKTPDYIGKMLKDEWFTRDTLESDSYNALADGDDATPDSADTDTPATGADPNAGQKKKTEEDFNFEDKDALVEAINAICQIIPHADEIRFVFKDERGVPTLRKRQSAKDSLAPYRFHWVEGTGKKAKAKQKAGFDVWIESHKRKEYRCAVFNPDLNAVAPDELNLFTGFAYEPKQGDWSLMKAHIRDNICQGDKELFRWVMGYMAQMFQRPWEKVGVAVALRGPKGIGKSTLTKWLLKIVGKRHGFKASQSQQCTGKFNAHLGINILLVASEAFFAGDPQVKGPLKDLISEDTQAIEAKGVDVRFDISCTHLWLDTNEDHAVPAEDGERRFFVLDVGKGQMMNTGYFAAINKQMENGGAEAMLYDLLHYDYSSLDLRNPPMTDALRDQITTGLKPQFQWLRDFLSDGELPFDDARDRGVIEIGPEGGMIARDDVFASFAAYLKAARVYRAPSRESLGKLLTGHFPDLTTHKEQVGGREIRYYVFPPLATMRSQFLDKHPGVHGFPDVPRAEESEKAPETTPAPPMKEARAAPVTDLLQHKAKRKLRF